MENKKEEVTFISLITGNKWLYAILIMLLLTIIVCFTLFYFSNKTSDSGITLSEFNAIETGMTYQEVVRIIGEEGTTLSSVDLGFGEDLATAMYVWYASNGIANANITFQGGKVIMKAQLGLH